VSAKSSPARVGSQLGTFTAFGCSRAAMPNSGKSPAQPHQHRSEKAQSMSVRHAAQKANVHPGHSPTSPRPAAAAAARAHVTSGRTPTSSPKPPTAAAARTHATAGQSPTSSPKPATVAAASRAQTAAGQSPTLARAPATPHPPTSTWPHSHSLPAAAVAVRTPEKATPAFYQVIYLHQRLNSLMSFASFHTTNQVLRTFVRHL
jgi:hypothetical protein